MTKLTVTSKYKDQNDIYRFLLFRLESILGPLVDNKNLYKLSSIEPIIFMYMIGIELFRVHFYVP